MIYLAGPIDQAPPGELAIRTLVLAALGELSVAVYDPASAITNGAADPHGTVRVNMAALERCRAVLALLPPGVPTIGTPMEIQHALHLRLPVAVVGGAGSVQLAGLDVPTFGCHEGGIQDAVLWARWDTAVVGAGA